MAEFTDLTFKDNAALNYPSDQYQFPNSDIDPASKQQKEYCIKSSQAIYSIYLRNKAAIPFAIRPYQEILRAYGMGAQSQNRYKSFLGGDDTTTSSTNTPSVPADTDGAWNMTRDTMRKGYNNINWEIVSPIPKIKAALKGILSEYDYDVNCDTIDEDSGAEKETKKWMSFVQMKDQQFIDGFKLKAGIPVNQETYIPESLEELELYEAAGGFKLNYARIMEKLIHFSYHISNWDEIKDKVIDDLFDWGMAGMRTYYDPETHLVKARYCDLSHAIIQYSQQFNYGDSEYAAELTLWTISKLRTYGFPEEELKNLAKTYSGQLGNANKLDWDRGFSTFMNLDGSYIYDGYKVIVCETQWKDQDKIYETVNTNKRGQESIMAGPYGKIKNTERNKTRITTFRRKYQCNWIVGSNMAFDFGLSPNQTENHDLDFIVWQIPGTSLTKRLVPIADNIQIGLLMYQNALSEGFDAGYMIDLDMLNNITIGGQKIDLLKALKFWRETNILPFRANKLGHSYQGGAVKPIDAIPGQLLAKIEEAKAMLATAMEYLEVVTGLNPLVLGGQPSPESAVRNNQIGISSSQNVIRPLILGVQKCKEKSASMITEMINLAIRNDKKAYDAYRAIIGESELDLLKTAEGNGVKYGIFMVAKPTPEQKQAILDAANISLGQHRDGKPGITLDQFMFIKRQLEEGVNLKQIEMRLGYMIKKAEEKDFFQKQQMIQQQNDALQQNKKMEVQSAAQGEQFKANAQMAIDNNKAHNEAALIILKHQADKETAQPIGSPVTSPLNVPPSPQQLESMGTGDMGGGTPPQQQIPIQQQSQAPTQPIGTPMQQGQ